MSLSIKELKIYFLFKNVINVFFIITFNAFLIWFLIIKKSNVEIYDFFVKTKNINIY